MISRPLGRVFLATLLVVTLLLKLAGSMRQKELTADDIIVDVARFLTSNGFEIDANTSDEDLFLVSATAGECRLLVALASPQGWHRHVIRQLAPAGSRVLFRYHGRSYEDQPVLLTRAYDYWSRFHRLLGSNPTPRPVYAIVGSSDCRMDSIPWDQLAGGGRGETPASDIAIRKAPDAAVGV
jgi:hypothetical protein